MGQGEGVAQELLIDVFNLGVALARNGWVTLTGGRNTGVMEAVCRGAKSGGGLTIGILPGENLEGASSAIDIPVLTGMGSARNWINILSSRVVIVCGMGAGTASEVALAIKAGKPLVFFRQSPEAQIFFNSLAGSTIPHATTVAQVIKAVEKILSIENEKGR